MARCASASRTKLEPPGREVTAETETEFTVIGEYDVAPAVATSARRGEGVGNESSLFFASPSPRPADAPEFVASESSVSSSTEGAAAFLPMGDPPFPTTRRGENASRNRRNGDAGTGGAFF